MMVLEERQALRTFRVESLEAETSILESEDHEIR